MKLAEALALKFGEGIAQGLGHGVGLVLVGLAAWLIYERVCKRKHA